MTTTPNRHGSMSALSRYGDLQPPEERNIPKVNEPALDVMKYAYALWSQVATQETPLERQYREAARILTPFKNSLESATQETFDDYFSRKSNPFFADGAFITAAFNLSGLATLVDSIGHNSIGCMLAEGKTLIVGGNKTDGRLGDVGYCAQGDIALLCGAVSFAYAAQGGVHISWGHTEMFGRFARNGLMANCSRSEWFGDYAEDCFLANYSEADWFGYTTKDVMLLNNGQAGNFGVHVTGEFRGVRINKGRIRSRHDFGNPAARNVNITDIDLASPGTEKGFRLFRRKKAAYSPGEEILHALESLRSLDAVKDMRDRPLEALALVKQCGWTGLREKLQGLVNTNG